MDIFAEIEISAPPEKPIPHPPLASIPIRGGITADPIRQKFYDMRSMASDNPYTWNDARLFYRQAKFMEGFTDDYTAFADFSMHYPCYQRMGYERLRTYFTWRTALRRAEATQTTLSYIFLHIYELLSCIGTNSPEDALAGLISLQKNYAPQFPALDNYLPQWLQDFHIYYNIPLSTPIFTYENSSLLDWNTFSSYDITKSKFYALPQNAELLNDCFPHVTRALAALAAQKSITLSDLFSHTSNQQIPWQPFRRALFHPHLNQPNRTTTLPNNKTYTVTSNKFTTQHTAPYAHKKDLVAYIIKKTEALLRRSTNHKKITADPTSLQKSTTALSQLNISIPEITATIESAISSYHTEKNRIEIKINPKNLTKIREEAADTTEKLIVEEVQNQDLGAQPQTPQGDAAPLTPIIRESNLVNALSEKEKDALKLIRSDGEVQKIKAFADREGLMLEILIDNINEKAMDVIGDNLVEVDGDTVIIYDDYLHYIDDTMGAGA
ncbi:MAG: TerB N-terminal domain-containing protein [Defluviitaleaceae bacterium]|nr:TerB N-terminal domain-containing protein [Defluviitaleaceae bacterium]